MSDSQVRAAFPAIQPQVPDQTTLKGLLHNALTTYLGILSESAPQTYDREVFRLKDKGFEGVYVQFPLYQKWDHARISPVIQLPGLRELLEYVRNRAEMQKTLAVPSETPWEPWELFVLAEMVHAPLAKALTDAAVDEAIDTGSVAFWQLPESYLSNIIDNIILTYLYNERRYSAKCLIGYVKGDPGVLWSPSDGIVLRKFNSRELVGYLTRSRKVLDWELVRFEVANPNVAMLEITGTYDPRPTKDGRPLSCADVIQEDIANKIDMIKWAIMMGTESVSPFLEHPITFEIPLSSQILPPFSRQERNEGGMFDLDGSKADEVKWLLSKASTMRQRSPDLRQVFFYWGRSALAKLDRDRLLDAVIGLEGLLVPNQGESRYRFSLHGTALLARFADSVEACNTELKNIYGKRSSLAHGNPGEGVAEASRALQLLGKAIEAILQLSDSGMLRLSEKVAPQIEKIVVRNSPIQVATTS